MGLSAKTDNRPMFQNMIKDSGKRLFGMVIVWKLGRFARNRCDSVRYKATLKKNGVKVVSAAEVISDGAEGIVLESVLEGSADLSGKVVRGMTENALKSKYNSVQHLLSNRRCIGEYTCRDIAVPEGIPAIVPRDLFDRVQERLAKNKKAPARHETEEDSGSETKSAIDVKKYLPEG